MAAAADARYPSRDRPVSPLLSSLVLVDSRGCSRLKPRLLFAVSGAYGDLALAVSFVHGQEFAERTTFLLPEGLYEANRAGLPVETRPYRSVEELLRAAREWRSDLVFLLSAYGFPVEGLCPPEGVGHFIEYLRKEGRRVVTTDPLLGAASTVTREEVLRMLPLPTNWLHEVVVMRRNAGRIARSFELTARILRDTIHLYPGPTDALENPAGVRRLSFFNPELTRRRREWEGPSGGQQPAPAGDVWLFVVASNDVALQQRGKPAGSFAGEMLRLFEQTQEAGRRPVLVAPSWFIQELEGVLPDSVQVELRPFCSYREFSSWLLDAEYAFFWNTFSCSAVHGRLARRLPVFFFARGHVAQFSERIYEDGLRCYFGGWEPTQLDPGAIRSRELAILATRQRGDVEAVIGHWKASPTPAQVVEQVLGPEPA